MGVWRTFLKFQLAAKSLSGSARCAEDYNRRLAHFFLNFEFAAHEQFLVHESPLQTKTGGGNGTVMPADDLPYLRSE
jgi:hypothetical protein